MATTDPQRTPFPPDADRPDTGPVRFAIVSLKGRAGSNLLVNMLNRHAPERLVCHGEVFNRKQIAARVPVPGFETTEQRDANPEGFLRSLESASLAETPGLHAVGFKVFSPHLKEGIEHTIGSGRYRLIWLQRENLLAQFSSLELATRTGEWRRWKGTKNTATQPGDMPEQATMAFDAGEFRAFLSEMAEREAWIGGLIDASPSPSVRVAYEALKTEAVRTEIGGLLGIGTLNPARIDLEKQNSSRLLERFTNPDDVRRCLDEIDRSEWIDEGEGSPAAQATTEPSRSGTA